jgi:ABC-2 type transport system permease protein
MIRPLIIFLAVTKNWMRSRSGLFFSIMFPVMLLLVFGAIFGGTGGTSASTLFVQNLDRNPDGTTTQLSSAFVEALNSTKTFAIKDVPADADAKVWARDNLGPLGGNIRIVMVSKGFQDDVLNGTLKVQVGISYSLLNTTYQYFARDPNFNATQKLVFEQGLAQLQLYNETLPDTRTSLTLAFDASDQSAQVIKNIVMNVANAFNYRLIGATSVIEFKEESVTSNRYGAVDYYLPGIIAAFTMTNGIIALTSVTTEFKRRGIIKRLSITPLTKFDWIIGNILSQTLLNLMLTAIMIVVGWIVFRVQAIPDALSIIMIFLGSVMFSGLGMVLGGLVKDVEAASALGNAIAFPMMFLSGTYFPMEFMPSYLQSFSRVLPLFYFSEGLRDALIYRYTEGVFTNMAVVSALAVAFIILGSVVTRWKEK